MSKFKEFMKKKLAASKPAKSPELMEARKTAIGGLRDDMASQLGGKLSGLKKVTVAAPDAEGLEEGLDAAGELVGGTAELEDSTEEMLGDAFDVESEDEQEEESEDKDPEDMSVEELEEHIAKLEQLKASKAGE